MAMKAFTFNDRYNVSYPIIKAKHPAAAIKSNHNSYPVIAITNMLYNLVFQFVRLPPQNAK